MSSKVKNIIIIIVLFVVALLIYAFFFTKDDDGALLGSTTGVTVSAIPGDQSDIGREFLTTLLNLEKFTLDDSIFLSNEFNSLRDFTIPIIPEGNEGRSNPFAPFVGDSTQSQVSPVTTNPPTNVLGTSATLNGTVDISLADSAKRFEYGLDTSLGSLTPLISEQSLTGFFSQGLTDLSPNTTYFYQAKVTVGVNTLSGDILSFTTTSGGQ